MPTKILSALVAGFVAAAALTKPAEAEMSLKDKSAICFQVLKRARATAQDQLDILKNPKPVDPEDFGHYLAITTDRDYLEGIAVQKDSQFNESCANPEETKKDSLGVNRALKGGALFLWPKWN